MNNLQDKKVLVIDDDPHILQLLVHTFSQAGAQVYIANCGQEGLHQFYVHHPDLVVLDVRMPDMDGWQICARMRPLADVPILFLTAMDGEEDIVKGLDCGAVDYVTKPFSPQVLLARARAALREAGSASGPEKPLAYHDGYLTVDLERRRVMVCGEPVKLSGTEYQLLVYLFQNAGQVLTLQQILDKVWGWGYRNNANYVHTYIYALRQKLEANPKNPCYLLTEHGVGYQFQKWPRPEGQPSPGGYGSGDPPTLMKF